MSKAILALLIFIALPMSLHADDFQLAVHAYCSGDDQTALNVFRPMAEAGHTGAQVRLGFMYLAGRGVPKNFVKAVYWYRLAANQGDTEAQWWLASLYESGHGVPRDLTEELKWTIASAQGGNSGAQLSLAYVFMGLAEGSSEFYRDEAIRWFRAAEGDGDIGAMQALADMYYHGKFESVPQSYDSAARLYRFAAEKGSGDAAEKLGLMYMEGKGVRQDDVYSYAWLFLSATDVMLPQSVKLFKRMTAEQMEEGRAVAMRLEETIASRSESACGESR
jgi:hypothetical protein